MRVEALSKVNLREGVFCAVGQPGADEWYAQLEAWLDADSLGGQVARGDDGAPVGFVLYSPVHKVPVEVEGNGFYTLQCIFVKPEYRGTGVGRVLIEAALADAAASGARGIAAEGFDVRPDQPSHHLPGTFLQHFGMTAVESRGLATLYYSAIDETAPRPRYLPVSFRPPKGKTRIRVDILDCRRCFLGISNRSVVDAVLSELGTEKFSVRVHDQNTRQAVVDKGMASGVFVDGRLMFFQGPVSEEDVLNALEVAINARQQRRDG